MKSENYSWEYLWDTFNHIRLQPQNKHQELIAGIEEIGLQKEIQKLLDAHESVSPILDDLPNWQVGFQQIFSRPTEISGYTIDKKIGDGGIGEVYLASKPEENFVRKVAIKFATVGKFSPYVLNSFSTELEVLLSLNHPNIERLYDGGVTADNVPFLIVEYIDGCHLDEYCDVNVLGVKQRLFLFQKICKAVDVVHRSLIVHRDIKASNIMVAKDGEPKLLDFGLAKLINNSLKNEEKHDSLINSMMTLAYASPEQVNANNITTASDIYSLGVLLYSLLTGQLPYRVDINDLPASKITINKYIPLLASLNIKQTACINKIEKKLNVILSGELEQIIAKSLSKAPENRYLSTNQFVEDIHNYLMNKPTLAHSNSIWYRSKKFIQRHVLGFSLSASAVIALIILSVILFLQSKDLKQSIREINLEQQRVIQVTTFLKDMFIISDPLVTDAKILKVNELLDYSSQQLSHQFNSEPLTKATLYETLGNVYLNMSRLPKAQEMFEQADLLYENNPIGQLNMYLARTRLYQQQGKFKRAETEISLLLKSYPLMTLDLEKQSQIEVYLGQIKQKLGDYIKAEIFLKSALSKIIELHGNTHPKVVDIYQLLGNAYWRMGDFKQVKYYYDKAYAINLDSLGLLNHKTLKSLSSLGVLAYSQGNLIQALEYFNRVAEAREQKLGSNHLLTADAYNRLGAVYFEMAEYIKAEKALNTAKIVYEKLDLIESNKYARILNNLGLIQRQNKQYLSALNTFEQVKSIYLKNVGENHVDLASTNNNLGMVTADLGQFEKALSLFKKTYQVLYEKNQLENVNIAFSMTNMGRMYLQVGDVKQAHEWIGKALILRREKLGENNIYSIETLSAYALVMLHLDKFKETHSAIETVIKERLQQLPINDWRIADAKTIQAVLQYQQGDNDALALFHCNLLIMQEKLGVEHYRVLAAIDRLKHIGVKLEDLNQELCI